MAGWGFLVLAAVGVSALGDAGGQARGVVVAGKDEVLREPMGV
ncbi:hypothetical protein [Arthrobacter sp. StoSoilB13]|nr:hypothetical protein [Arthrobacter sp. StoSoilB13]